MNVTVYCGAHIGKDPEFAKRAAELGTWLGQNGHRLVYGAGNAGMMGTIAEAALAAGGEVLGVSPEFFLIGENLYEGLTELRLTKDLGERRRIMIEEGDAYIALPGGTGTIDEITEVMSLMRLGRLGPLRKPVMLYNINGYYDSFFTFLDRILEEEYFGADDRAAILDVRSIGDIERALSTAGEFHAERNTLYDE